ncbi:uncharacterized protein LOC126746414 [Anthonomus grandis grandis]|uniref:uncharacterized protein LOC126746414 n=1 Tax=Anthonomus grandis grandis TaxID=2921223 RepID=UPI002165BFE7|nr:uncharacterized protein LOC126746414 [Anthonomus grandis grandis]XP_050310628.1 uncharacterized protein LOC126746414 [Anthonomus grandis grandis]
MLVRTYDIRLTVALLTLLDLTREVLAVKLTAIKIPAYVRAGDSVTFRCEYDLEGVDLYSIKWYRNDEEFYRYVPKESPPFRSFSIKYINVDVSKSGENVVTLRGVQRQLTADYKCEVSADGPFFHTDILVARMIVVELPTEHPILRVEPHKVDIGKKLAAECFVLPCDPPANISWFINNQKMDTNALDSSIRIYKKQDEQDPLLGLWTSRSRMEVRLERKHVVQGLIRIKCLATIYTIWNDTAEEEVKDETFTLAQILESTIYYGQVETAVENGGGPLTFSSSLLWALLLIL